MRIYSDDELIATQGPSIAQGEARPVAVPALLCRCFRCDNVWISVGTTPPVSCARCKYRNWRVPGRWKWSGESVQRRSKREGAK